MRTVLALALAAAAVGAALAQPPEACPPEGCPVPPQDEAVRMTDEEPAFPDEAAVWAGLVLVALVLLLAAWAWSARRPGGLFWRR